MDPLPTRERLLQAATRVFLADGFETASMDRVRQEAGVSNGSLYHHFPTKAQLADALYAHTLRDLHSGLLATVGSRMSSQSGVKAMVRGYIAWVLAHPDGARLLKALRRGSALPSEGEWTQANAEGLRPLREWVERMAAAGEMRPIPFPAWMAIVFSPAMALTPHWVAQPEPAVSPKVRAALEHAAWMGVAP